MAGPFDNLTRAQLEEEYSARRRELNQIAPDSPKALKLLAELQELLVAIYSPVDAADDRGRRHERRKFLKFALSAFERHVAIHGGSLTPPGVARVRDEVTRAFSRRSMQDLTSFRDVRGRLCSTAVDEFVEAYVLIAVDPERQAFAAIAYTVLVQIQTRAENGRLPRDIVERAYDLTVTAIERRARRGIDGFRERPGVPDPVKVGGYVQVVFEFKVKEAWKERTARPSEIPYDAEFDAWWDVSQSGEGIGDDDDWDELLRAARAWLAEFEREGQRLERRRLGDIELALIAAAVTPQSIDVVLARAARRWVTDVTVDGLRRRALPPAGWREIAERLGISTPNNAAKILSRALEGLSPVVRRWINAPESYGAGDGNAPASPDAG